MKEVKHYICDICGTEYNDKNQCAGCETGHRQPKKIVRTKYLPIKINALGIPQVIEVEFDDGSKFEYKR